MISARLAALLARRDIHYGWVVAASTFLTMLVTAGAMGAPGVLIVPLETEFGWSTADISTALAIRLVLFGLMGPFAAAFMNRFGVRTVTVTALLMVTAGLLGSLVMRELWHLFVLWGLVVGVGTGLTALVLGATVATRWFTKRRGLVVGLLTASSATGQLIFMPLLADLSDRIGWRGGIVVIVGLLAVTAVAVLALMRDRPADVDLAPYGETAIVPAPRTTPGLAALATAPLFALAEASRSRTFWILFATFFICGLSTNGLIQTHFVTLCGDYGMAAVAAAGVLAMMGLFDFVGTIGSGWLSDRYDNRWLLFWYYGLRGLALMALPFSDFTLYGLSLFAVFYGLDWVATVPPTVRLSAERFGRERSNLVFGWIFTGHQLGAASAAFGAGVTRTQLASYLPAFFAAGAFCLVAALIVLFINRREKEKDGVPAAVPAPAKA